MAHTLLLLNGPTPGVGVALRPARGVRIGRHHSCELRIDDDQVSRQHARVELRAGAWFVLDCGSTNGTQVNSRYIDAAALECGDLIGIGGRLILFVDNQQTLGAERFRTSRWKATTMAARTPAESPWASVVRKSMHGAVSRVVRDSAVLCRLANQLHRRQSAKQLIAVAAESLTDGMGADGVTCWRIGVDGRLHCIGRRGSPCDDQDEAIMPRLALDQQKAIFFPPEKDEQASVGKDEPDSVGHRVCVPIPGHAHYLGAIECHRLPDHPSFDRSNLDFVMVVAYQVGLAIENLEHRERLKQANEHLRERVAKQNNFEGSSIETAGLLEKVARVGSTSSTVLVLGESGTGKELIAQSIHEASDRFDGPYIAVNCAAPNESLLESELFGHEAGAFTGAEHRRIGQFERAHRGTIFLDEVGEMSLNCQVKLLRMLEGHPFERVGGEQSIHVDVRIIAATHRDLAELVRERQFREDLYYRLCVIDIRVPPLRERGDDAVELASIFLERYHRQLGRGPSRLSDTARDAIQSYTWPGNVRQLKNSIERAVVLGNGETVDLDMLGITPPVEPSRELPLITLREAERRHIEYVLHRLGGNKSAACKTLAIGRGTLYAKLEAYGKERTG